jgi:hypothetical protein
MRMARIKIAGRGAVYHCISRIVGGEPLLGDLEKEQLRLWVWRQAAFSGLEVITYCLLSNHLHLLVRVPAQLRLTDAQLVERARAYYGSQSPYVRLLQDAWEASGSLPPDLRTGLSSRMGDLSVYMKELKQRFSLWYNKSHQRFGTLWAERFKSLVVEEEPGTVRTVAAYVDLNPVRAGLVEDAKDYRWSGYGEAVAGQERARRGLASFQEGEDWAVVGPEYRKVLLVSSGWAGRSGKVVRDGEGIRRELARGGKLSLGEVLRLRVRYFSDGVVLGSRNYVNAVFAEYRDRFGARRRTGARPLRGLGALSHLATLRDLRVDAVG